MAATTRRKINQSDPTDLPVQISFRVPWRYREQLLEECAKLRVTLPNLVVDALERVYPPKG